MIALWIAVIAMSQHCVTYTFFLILCVSFISGDDYAMAVIDRSEMEDNIFTNLPVDVFERIMNHLPLKDYVGLNAICRSFRKIVSHAIENKRLPFT